MANNFSEYISYLKQISKLGGQRGASAQAELLKYNEDQVRDEHGRWTSGSGGDTITTAKEGGTAHADHMMAYHRGMSRMLESNAEKLRASGDEKSAKANEKAAELHTAAAAAHSKIGEVAYMRQAGHSLMLADMNVTDKQRLAAANEATRAAMTGTNNEFLKQYGSVARQIGLYSKEVPEELRAPAEEKKPSSGRSRSYGRFTPIPEGSPVLGGKERLARNFVARDFKDDNPGLAEKIRTGDFKSLTNSEKDLLHMAITDVLHMSTEQTPTAVGHYVSVGLQTGTGGKQVQNYTESNGTVYGQARADARAYQRMQEGY